MLSVNAEAEREKTLVGLGRPAEAGASLGFFDETLPESGIREVDEPDDDLEGDAFSEDEADTRSELVAPAPSEPPPPGAMESTRIPESSPLPDVSDLLELYPEPEPMLANWEDDDEATRPQLFLPQHPSDPPPGLPGSRMASSQTPFPVPSEPRNAEADESALEAVEAESVDAAPSQASAHVASTQDVPTLAAADELKQPPSGLNPRLSGMLAGAGMGAAAAVGLVALLSSRAPGSRLAEALPPESTQLMEAVPRASDGTLTASVAAANPEPPESVDSLNALELPSERVVVSATRRPTQRIASGITTRGANEVAAWPVNLDEDTAVMDVRGTLLLSSVPPVNVVLDGRPVGMTPRALPVNSGEHTVLFVHPTLGRKTVRVDVENNEKTEVAAKF